MDRMGWRARIGLIVPSLNVTIEPELNSMAPPGISLHAARVLLRRGTAEDLVHMAEETEDAAVLLATAGVDLILFACTTGSMVGGLGWDKELAGRIEAKTGIRATTTATAVVEALNALGVRRVAVATPYSEELNKLEEDFLKAQGFTVVNIEGLGFVTGEGLHALPPAAAYRAGLKADRPEADGLFLSCTDFNSASIVDALERDVAKPVISSNTASLWHSLKLLRIGDPISGYGRLFTCERAG